MKVLIYIQLLQGILHKLIDEIQDDSNIIEEENLPSEDELDLLAFDTILNKTTALRDRYLEFKATQPESEDEYPDFNERLELFQLITGGVDEDEDDNDDEGNSGGLH